MNRQQKLLSAHILFTSLLWYFLNNSNNIIYFRTIFNFNFNVTKFEHASWQPCTHDAICAHIFQGTTTCGIKSMERNKLYNIITMHSSIDINIRFQNVTLAIHFSTFSWDSISQFQTAGNLMSLQPLILRSLQFLLIIAGKLQCGVVIKSKQSQTKELLGHVTSIVKHKLAHTFIIKPQVYMQKLQKYTQ